MQQPRVDSAFSRSRSSSVLLGRRSSESYANEAEQEASASEEASPAMDRRSRSQLQPPRANMDWPDWAVRTQRLQERLASTLEQLIWGSIGALMGTAIAGIPAIMDGVRSGYPFVLWQPFGAAVGATFAIVVLSILARGRRTERERLTAPSAWASLPDR